MSVLVRRRRASRWRVLVLVVAFSALAALPVLAGVDAELAFHRGVAAFGRGDYAAARQNFEHVLTEDPEDAFALHYLGMIDQAQGDHVAAIERLERVLEIDPENSDARVDIAASLIKLGSMQRARQQLDEVLAIEPDRADAHLYLGIIGYRERAYADAIDHLKRAGELDPGLEVEASYYLGLAQAFAGDLDASAGAFGVVEQIQPTHPLGRSAAELRSQVRPTRRIWSAALTGGVEYDSNISVTGDDVQKKKDGRGIVRLQGKLRPLEAKRGSLDVGYDGFVGLYFDQGRFSQMTHLAWTAGSLAAGPVRLSARYDYAYTTLDVSDRFRHLHRATPGIAIPTGDWGVAQLYYQFQYFDYLQPVTNPAFERDGPNHSVGANEFFFLPEPFGYARLGARLIRYLPEGSEFEYDGLEASTGGELQLPLEARLQLVYVYQRRNYKNRSIVDPALRERRDNGHLISVELGVPLWRRLDLALAGSFTFNGSNVAAFDYDRQIAGCYLRYEF